jgi:hypothetical protein
LDQGARRHVRFQVAEAIASGEAANSNVIENSSLYCDGSRAQHPTTRSL